MSRSLSELPFRRSIPSTRFRLVVDGVPKHKQDTRPHHFLKMLHSNTVSETPRPPESPESQNELMRSDSALQLGTSTSMLQNDPHKSCVSRRRWRWRSRWTFSIRRIFNPRLQAQKPQKASKNENTRRSGFQWHQGRHRTYRIRKHLSAIRINARVPPSCERVWSSAALRWRQGKGRWFVRSLLETQK